MNLEDTIDEEPFKLENECSREKYYLIIGHITFCNAVHKGECIFRSKEYFPNTDWYRCMRLENRYK